MADPRTDQESPERARERARVFRCTMPAAVVWADLRREKGGDHARLGSLGFARLGFSEAPGMLRLPGWLRDEVRAEAAALRARRGERLQVSACGQTVVLGWALPALEAAGEVVP